MRTNSARFAPALMMGLVWATSCVAQTLTPAAASRLALAGDRIEALVVLGEDSGASGGAYAFRGNADADLKISKVGGSGDIGDPKPLGIGDMKWNLTLGGNIGRISGQNDATAAPFIGSTVQASMYGAEFGGGARFWFNDHFSMAVGLSGIYGHTKQEVSGLSATAKQYLGAAQKGDPVTWNLDTWTAVPMTDLKYQWFLQRTTVTFKSVFTFFHTESFNSPSPLINLDGNSQTWRNYLDVDIPLGKTLFGYELHTGGHIDQTELFGNVSTGLDTNHLYTVNGRLVLDMQRSFQWLQWLGLGYSYTWSGNLSGWSVGIDARLKL